MRVLDIANIVRLYCSAGQQAMVSKVGHDNDVLCMLAVLSAARQALLTYT